MTIFYPRIFRIKVNGCNTNSWLRFTFSLCIRFSGWWGSSSPQTAETLAASSRVACRPLLDPGCPTNATNTCPERTLLLFPNSRAEARLHSKSHSQQGMKGRRERLTAPCQRSWSQDNTATALRGIMCARREDACRHRAQRVSQPLYFLLYFNWSTRLYCTAMYDTYRPHMWCRKCRYDVSKVNTWQQKWGR